MRALVVYESLFGTTGTIAYEIAKTLSGIIEVEAVKVDDAPQDLTGIDLLVVGGPTHVHGMSRPETRRSAAEQGSATSGEGIREWISGLTTTPAQLRVAVFDTRVDKPRWFTGSAARAAMKLLRRRNMRPIAAPESFLVTTGTPPQLVAAERARAGAWGETLASALTAVV